MAALLRGGTLLNQVPALGGLSPRGSGLSAGELKLIPIGVELEPLTLSAGLNRIGRASGDNDLVVAHEKVSRRHCEVQVDAGGAIKVRDLGSNNGTFVNGQQIEEARLAIGDELAVSWAVPFRLVVDELLSEPERVRLTGLDDKTEVRAPAQLSSPAARRPPPLPRPPGGAKPPPSAPTGAFPRAPGKGPARSTASAPAVERRKSRASAAATRVPPATGAMAALPAASPAGDAAPRAGAQPVTEDAESLRRQRDTLAILFQVSVRCLQSKEVQEIERLLTNVLRRLLTPGLGFLVYRREGASWRAAIIPGTDSPRDLVQLVSQYAVSQPEPQLIDDRRWLDRMGVEVASLLIVPLRLEEETRGALCLGGVEAQLANADTLELVTQLGNVAAAALLRR